MRLLYIRIRYVRVKICLCLLRTQLILILSRLQIEAKKHLWIHRIETNNQAIGSLILEAIGHVRVLEEVETQIENIIIERT
jgi:hypothetical protein